MNWKDRVDRLAGVWPLFEEAYAPARAVAVVRRYRRRREYYESVVRRTGLAYDENVSRHAARERLAKRGYRPPVKQVGGVHTFAFLPDISWHNDLCSDLEQLGLLTRYDYTAEGYQATDMSRPM